jgi:hypothetical protein
MWKQDGFQCETHFKNDGRINLIVILKMALDNPQTNKPSWIMNICGT